jgi:serine phosphatase RsbU (regulator of sigma subunit)
MSSGRGWTLSEIQGLREHMEMQSRFHLVEQEVKARRIIGDDVYDFVQRGGLRAIIGDEGEAR